MDEKNSRQELIPGWRQDLLRNATVGLITEAGNMLLARNITLLCASLGIGKVKADYFGDAYEYKLAKSLGLRRDETKDFSDAKIIIDATNNSASKEETAKACAKAGIPFASVSSNAEKLYYFAFYSKNYDAIAEGLEKHLNEIENSFEGKKHGAFTSLMAAGIATDRARREIFETPDDAIYKVSMRSYREGAESLESLVYNLCSKLRFDNSKDYKLKDESVYANKTVMLVGAGGVGVAVAKGLLDAGVGRLIVLDSDSIKPHNLNRQFWYPESIGKYKAVAIAEEMNKHSGKNSAAGIITSFNHKSTLPNPKPDLIIAAVDNNYSRVLLNEFALKHDIPLIETATSAVSAGVQVFAPPHTYCLRHIPRLYLDAKEAFEKKKATIASDATKQINKLRDRDEIVEELITPLCSGQPAASAEDRERYAAFASVVMPTTLAGGLALAEGQILLQDATKLVPTRLEYNATYGPRFKLGHAPTPGTCNCHLDKKNKIWPDIPFHVEWPDITENEFFRKLFYGKLR